MEKRKEIDTYIYKIFEKRRDLTTEQIQKRNHITKNINKKAMAVHRSFILKGIVVLYAFLQLFHFLVFAFFFVTK